jgi:hypothetical protein
VKYDLQSGLYKEILHPREKEKDVAALVESISSTTPSNMIESVGWYSTVSCVDLPQGKNITVIKINKEPNCQTLRFCNFKECP